MSLLNKASLIQIPSGYKDGTLYSAKPTNGDGDFTFSRGSNLAATRVNSDGLIEKGRENLLLQSNQFDTTWSQSNVSVTSGQTGYDGSNDAWLLSISGGTSDQRIFQNIQYNGVSTLSVYAKKNDSNWLSLRIGSSVNKWYDLENGVLGGSTIVTAYIDASIEDVGNGWYRCSLTFTDNFTTSTRIYPAENDLDITHTSGSIYIQDAQTEVGLVATDYIETGASTAQAGILEDMPRLDYSGGASCPSLLLEPQRSNVLPQSEYFEASDWNLLQASINSSDINSPEGLLNCYKLIPNTSNTTHIIYDQITVSASTYTASGFFKADGYDYGNIRLATDSDAKRYSVTINLSDGSFASDDSYGSPTNTDYKIETIGKGWYRLSVTSEHTGGFIYYSFSLSNTANPTYSNGLPQFAGDNTNGVLIYGAMLEAGSYPTSYIPTYGGASVTRGADASSDSNVTPTSNKATLFIEISGDDDSYSRNVCAFRNGTTNQYGLYFWGTDNNKFGFNSWQADSYGITNSTIFDGNIHKIAAVFDFTDFTTNTLFIDGVKQSISQVKGTTIQRTANKVSLIATQSNQNPRQNLHQFICFDSGLSDDECIQLTTI